MYFQKAHIFCSCFLRIPYQQIGGEEQEKLVPLAFYCPSLLPPPRSWRKVEKGKGRERDTLASTRPSRIARAKKRWTQEVLRHSSCSMSYGLNVYVRRRVGVKKRREGKRKRNFLHIST